MVYWVKNEVTTFVPPGKKQMAMHIRLLSSSKDSAILPDYCADCC
jgi:hypothetical protein